MVFFINKYEFDASVNIFFLLKEDYAAIYLSLKNYIQNSSASQKGMYLNLHIFMMNCNHYVFNLVRTFWWVFFQMEKVFMKSYHEKGC